MGGLLTEMACQPLADLTAWGAEQRGARGSPTAMNEKKSPVPARFPRDLIQMR